MNEARAIVPAQAGECPLSTLPGHKGSEQMTTDVGRVPDGTGLSSPIEPASGLAPSGVDPSREEFCARFKARMLAVAGPTFDDGGSIAEYADQTAPTYFETDWQRVEGPEGCADADMSYWGEE